MGDRLQSPNSAITQRDWAEKALAEEMRAMMRLQELSTMVLETGELEGPLTAVLEAAIDILGADFGNIQLFDEETNVLRIVVHSGLQKRFLDYFAKVDDAEGSACGMALADKRTVAIEDVENEPRYAPSLEEARAAGYRAVQSTPLVARAGKMLGMLSTQFRQPRRFSEHDLRLVDICARQAADAINAYLLQRQLRESEARLRKVLESDAIAVMFFDDAGTLVDANGAFLRMTGHSRRQIEARELTWRKMTPPEWIDESLRQLGNLKRTGHIGPYEKEYLLEDGTRRWMMFVGRRIEKNLVVEFAIDISDRKRSEEELRRAKAEAEQAAASKTRFFAAASHDLRQPFQAMRLFYDVLNQSGTTSQRPALDSLGHAIRSAEDMLNDLLDFARLDSGATKFTPAGVDIANIINELIADLRGIAAQKRLVLKGHAPSVIVHTDPMVLKRVVFNLVANALKYTENGGVLVGIRQRPGRALVEVWDTGIGIGEDQGKLIFEEFYQAQNPARDRTKGVGLGLAIVRRLCDLMGSEVSFASRPGKGSVFRVAIPIEEPNT